MARNKKYSIEELRQVFEAGGCILISEVYVKAIIPLDYICKCGRTSRVRIHDFLGGMRCKKCANEKLSLNKRHDYAYVANKFKENGCKLLESQYIDSKTPMKYLCNCGNKSKICFSNFLEGKRCKQCGIEKRSESRRRSYETVKRVFEENGCVLLSDEYVNNITPMDYLCNCGNTSKICFDSFKSGARCKKCATEKLSGENSPHYNHDKTYEERILERGYPEYHKWRSEVFERDEYTCRCCGVVGSRLAAHHLDGYNWCKERRVDVTNGVTLCRDCHTDFHRIYRNGNNTEAQYDEWLRNNRKQDAI